MLLEKLCGTEKHGGVHIVTAAVHFALLLAFIFDVSFFFDGQSVHIGSDKNCFAVFFAADKSRQTAFSAVLRFISHFGKLFFYQSLGFFKLKTDLGMTVNFTPAFLKLRLKMLSLPK